MAAAIWYVRKTNSETPSTTLIDGIHSAITNADDGDSEATVIAEVETTMGLPAGYFDSAVLALGVGNLDADQDAVAFGSNRAPAEFIA